MKLVAGTYHFSWYELAFAHPECLKTCGDSLENKLSRAYSWMTNGEITDPNTNIEVVIKTASKLRTAEINCTIEDLR